MYAIRSYYVVSKITKNKPKPTFLTDGADWELQQKAKKLTKFCEGVFYGAKVYQEATKAFIDACIFGTGAVKFFACDGEIKCERVLIDEILTRITSYNVCYTKLLRPRHFPTLRRLQKFSLPRLFLVQNRQIYLQNVHRRAISTSNS